MRILYRVYTIWVYTIGTFVGCEERIGEDFIHTAVCDQNPTNYDRFTVNFIFSSETVYLKRIMPKSHN